jgi:lipopolysaccharide exporter
MISRNKILSAGVWSSVSIGCASVLRLAVAIFTARILMPADFGVLAVTCAMLAFMDKITYLGVESALVQRRDINDEDLNVAWTFEFIRKNLLGLLLILGLPVLVHWVSDPRFVWVVVINCFMLFISTFRNNGPVVFRRELQFRQIFLLEFIPALVQTLLCIVFLLLWLNIWAILASSVVGGVLGVALTYRMHPHRPQFVFHWAKLRELFSFGAYLLGNTMIDMIQNQGVVIALTKFSGIVKVGHYDRASAFSRNIFTQIQGLIWRVGYPALSKAHNETQRVDTLLRPLVRHVLLILMPICTLYAAAAPDLIPFALGTKWYQLVPLVQLFCLQASLLFALTPLEIAFQAIGRPRLGTECQAVGCVTFLGLLYPAVHYFDLAGVIVAMVVATTLSLPVYWVYTWRHMHGVSFQALLRYGFLVGLLSAGVWCGYHALAMWFLTPWGRLCFGVPGACTVCLLIFVGIARLCPRSGWWPLLQSARGAFGALVSLPLRMVGNRLNHPEISCR